MDAQDYKLLFQQSSTIKLVIDTNFTIVSVSDAFLAASKTVRENITNRYLFDVFPENPDELNPRGGTNIRASFNRVIANKTIDTLEVVRYDIPNPEGGGYIQKYWRTCHSPIFDADNNVKYIVQVAEDVTDNETLTIHLEQEKKALKQIEDSEKRYNMLLMKSPFGFAVLRGENMVISLANDSIKDFWGKGKDVEGKALFDIIPELRNSDFPNLLKDVYKTGKPFYGDELLAPLVRNKKLEDVYFNFIYQPYLEADETISGVAIIAYEVTPKALLKKGLAEQRAAEQKALKSIEESTKRHYNMLMESPFAFCVLKGKDMVISLANDLIKEFWGKGQDVEGKPLLELLPELTNQPYPSIINNVYETGIPYYANEILAQLTNNGKLEDRYFNVVYQAIREADDVISGVTTIAYDVTEHVLSRKKMEENDNFNRSVLNASPDCIKILDAEGRLQFMNENGITLLEIDDFNLFKDKYWWDLWEEDNKQLIKDAVAKAHSGQKVQFQAQRVTANGIIKWWDIIVLPIKLNTPSDKSGSFICVSRDITEYTNATLKVKEVEHSYQEMIYSSPSLILILNGEDLIVTFSNDAMLEVLGKGPDIINKPLLQVIPEVIEQGLGDLLLKVFKTGEPQYGYESPVYLIRDAEKKLFHFTFVYQAQRNLNGEIVGVAVIAQEVTPQALLNQKIKTREEQFSLLVAQAPVAICVIRGEKYVVEIANEKILEIWGRTEAQVLNKPIFEVLTELEDQGFEALVDNVYATGERFVTSELPLTIMRNGQLENAYVTFVYEPLREVDGTISGMMVLAHEITDLVVGRKKMEIQNALFEDMLMTAPGFVSILSGPNHIYKLVNDQYQSLFPNHQIKGKPLMSAFPELKGQGFDELMNKVYTTGESYVGIDIPVYIARNEGLTPELRYFNFSYQAMYDEFKNIHSILNFGYEVTEQMNAKKRIEESEKHFRQMADLMPAKISNADIEGNVTYFNNHWLDYTGLSFEELKDFGYHTIMHPDEIQEFQERFANASATKTVLEMEMRFLNKNGQFKWHLNLASPVLDDNGNIKMWVGSSTEIHEQLSQKSALELAVNERTAALEIANKELLFQNKEKEKRAAELHIANEKLVFQNEEKGKRATELSIANKELEAFNYVSSHDLQEPLRKIQTFAALILEKEQQNLSDNGKYIFRRMQLAANRMQELIQDLLSFSRLNKSDRKFEPTQLAQIVTDVLLDFKDTIEAKQAKVDVTSLVEINIIPFQFRQLLQNLLSNALKFAKTDTPLGIAITCKIAKGSQLVNPKLLPETNYCHMVFEDNGIGFDQTFSERIFEVFQKLHSKEEYVGTGIGLAIVKKIVENHNGFVSATSQVGKGTRFDIYIPINLKNKVVDKVIN